jgi:hypothetical protein
LLGDGDKGIEIVYGEVGRWAFRAGTRNFYPWLLWSAQYKIFFFLAIHYFHLCVPIAQQAGQADVHGRLSPVTTHKKSKEYLQTPRREHLSFPNKILFL